MYNVLSKDYKAENPVLLQKDIFRLATLLYSETNNTFSNIDVQLHIVKCIFSQNNNEFMSLEEILSNILESYKYNLSEEELGKILRQPKIFETSTIDSNKVYKLIEREYEKINQYISKNIDYYINQFIDIVHIERTESCRDAIYKYLYELTTTNINSYKVLLSLADGSNLSDSELSVNGYDLSDSECKYVHDFIEWENPDKNVALSNIVFCCLEYCLLVSGDKPNSLISKSIRNREIYLDTNIIFRALGINGVSRQNVVNAFLRKCNQAKIKIIVSKLTKKEFEDTIDYYVSQILEFPRGKVFIGAYESLSDYNLYSFYDEWYLNHENLSLIYFRIYVHSLYSDFINKYKIHEDDLTSNSFYKSEDFKAVRDRYAKGILKIKRELKNSYTSDVVSFSSKDKHDASLARYIELYRSENSEKKDVFFVSSDKVLRFWDMTRGDHEYPIVIYPSQLFLILIKICGRSENDLESFVSFINIRPRSQQMTVEKANIIISGISSITEDIKIQKTLVSCVFDEEFQNIIKHSNTDKELYQQIQTYSQHYLENELKSKEEERQIIQKERDSKTIQINELTDYIQKKDTILEEIGVEKGNVVTELGLKENELEFYRERICKFAEKRILPMYRWRWYVLPTLIVIYSLFVVVFIALQFLFCDASWNFVNILFDIIKNTTFGKGVQDYIYVVDVALSVFIGVLIKYLWRNPLDKAEKQDDKTVRVEQYIKNNHLK